MHIGELAARSGRSVHTLRYYEAEGLIPGVSRDGGGRRIYAPLHVGWLDLLERLQRTGMSLEQMRSYAALVERGQATLQERRALLQAHRKRLDAMIDDLNVCRAVIDGKIAFYGAWLASGKRPPLEDFVEVRSAPPGREGVRKATHASRRRTSARDLREKRRAD